MARTPKYAKQDSTSSAVSSLSEQESAIVTSPHETLPAIACEDLPGTCNTTSQKVVVESGRKTSQGNFGDISPTSYYDNTLKTMSEREDSHESGLENLPKKGEGTCMTSENEDSPRRKLKTTPRGAKETIQKEETPSSMQIISPRCVSVTSQRGLNETSPRNKSKTLQTGSKETTPRNVYDATPMSLTETSPRSYQEKSQNFPVSSTKHVLHSKESQELDAEVLQSSFQQESAVSFESEKSPREVMENLLDVYKNPLLKLNLSEVENTSKAHVETFCDDNQKCPKEELDELGERKQSQEIPLIFYDDQFTLGEVKEKLSETYKSPLVNPDFDDDSFRTTPPQETTEPYKQISPREEIEKLIHENPQESLEASESLHVDIQKSPREVMGKLIDVCKNPLLHPNLDYDSIRTPHETSETFDAVDDKKSPKVVVEALLLNLNFEAESDTKQASMMLDEKTNGSADSRSEDESKNQKKVEKGKTFSLEHNEQSSTGLQETEERTPRIYHGESPRVSQESKKLDDTFVKDENAEEGKTEEEEEIVDFTGHDKDSPEQIDCTEHQSIAVQPRRVQSGIEPDNSSV